MSDKEKTETIFDEQKALARVESRIFFLYTEEPFLGYIMMYLDKRPDNKCPTAYVTVAKGTDSIRMGYNLKFMDSLTDEQITSVLKHELYHVIFLHITSRYMKDVNGMIFNIAADLVVNYFVAHRKVSGNGGQALDLSKKEDVEYLNKILPLNCYYPGRNPSKDPKDIFGKFIEKLPPNKTLNYYVEELRKFAEKHPEFFPKPCSGMGIDDHGSWEGADITDQEMEVIRQKIEGIGEAAQRNANEQKSWGSTSSSIQEILSELYSKEVDWRTIVKQFFGRSQNSSFNSTVKRYNKRFPEFPGNKKKTHAQFAYFIDQSGSMDDEDVKTGFAEISGLSKLTQVDVYNFDTEVDESSHEIWKCGKKHPWKRTRSGGTNFDCVREFVSNPKNRSKWSGVVIFTDGYAPTMGAMPPGIRVIWIITENGQKPQPNERDLVVQIKGLKPEK